MASRDLEPPGGRNLAREDLSIARASAIWVVRARKSASAQNLLEGVHLFAQNCAVCHGSAKGAASPSPVAKGPYPKPPQLATDGVEDDPEGDSFWKIKHGIRLTGMPSFGYTLSDRQIWTLALFLKHMDQLPPAAQQAWQQVRNWPEVAASQTAQQ